MPYALAIRVPVEIADRERYVNDCCIGGDLVLERLLPSLRKAYGDLESTQEDWGWFVWFKHSGVNLAIDVHTNEEATGEFQMHLTSRKPRLLLPAKIQDTPELEVLQKLLVSELETWPVTSLELVRVDEKYNPIESADVPHVKR